MARRKKYDTWIAVLQNAAKDGSVPDDGPAFWGFDFGALVPTLDGLATRAGLAPLGGFYFDDSVFDDEAARQIIADRHGPTATFEDMDEDTFESLPDLIRVYRSWKGPFFAPADGLRTVLGLKAWVAVHAAEVDQLVPSLSAQAVGGYLDELRAVLEYGQRMGRDFRLAPEGPA